jgi:hypothetical protein
VSSRCESADVGYEDASMTPPLTRYYVSNDGSLVSVARHIPTEYTRAVYLAADVDAMLEAFFTQLASGWDIEPREVFEREAPTNGFRWPICQALHHTWKRDVKEAARDETLETLRRDNEELRESLARTLRWEAHYKARAKAWKLDREAWKDAYDTEHAAKTAASGALERLRAAMVAFRRWDSTCEIAWLDNSDYSGTSRPSRFTQTRHGRHRRLRCAEVLASASRPTEAPK